MNFNPLLLIGICAIVLVSLGCFLLVRRRRVIQKAHMEELTRIQLEEDHIRFEIEKERMRLLTERIEFARSFADSRRQADAVAILKEVQLPVNSAWIKSVSAMLDIAQLPVDPELKIERISAFLKQVRLPIDPQKDELARAFFKEAQLWVDSEKAEIASVPIEGAKRDSSHIQVREQAGHEQTEHDQFPGTSEKHVEQAEQTVQNQSGGVDISSETTSVRGDVIGRDKITYVGSSSIKESERRRRLEATFPAQPGIGCIESLYVQVKMPESLLNPEARTHTMVMPFRTDASTGEVLPTPFKIKVIAPGFRVHGGDEKILRVLPDEDSHELEFQLQCETDQAVKIQVEVYAESGFLGQVDMPVKPIIGQQIPAPSERMWIRGILVLGTLPNVTVSTSW
jgi:hypothetical protein